MVVEEEISIACERVAIVGEPSACEPPKGGRWPRKRCGSARTDVVEDMEVVGVDLRREEVDVEDQSVRRDQQGRNKF